MSKPGQFHISLHHTDEGYGVSSVGDPNDERDVLAFDTEREAIEEGIKYLDRCQRISVEEILEDGDDGEVFSGVDVVRINGEIREFRGFSGYREMRHILQQEGRWK